ncbi:hypothetical protein [Pseudoalteromonas lipolytica]
MDILKGLLGSVIGLSSLTTVAADIDVVAGAGTLQIAVNAAQSGDTLVLQSGVYTVTDNQLILDKPLTIRAASAQSTVTINASILTHPQLSAPLEFIRLQGVTLNAPHWCFGAYSTTIQTDVLEMLEVTANCLSFTLKANNEVTVIGSKLSSSYDRLSVESPTSKIFGNELVFRNGVAVNSDEVSFIGNEVTSFNASESSFSGAQSGHKLIAANRFHYRITDSSSYGYNALTTGKVMRLLSTYSRNIAPTYITNNIFKIDLTHFTGFKDPGALEQIKFLNSSSSSQQYDFLYNNIIDMVGLEITQPGSNVSDLGPMFANELGAFEGNIVVNYNDDVLSDISKVNAKYNLGFNNASQFDTENGNINADPMFNDDYSLQSESPAIDTGPIELFRSDIDLTRSDIGAFAGSWNIEQYDVQRNEDTAGPFIYPVLEAHKTVVNGELKLQFISYPRLK